MLTTVTGLIIRTADVKESDRLVTIFTEETGVITAIAKGARSIKSRQMSATLQFCYGRYVLYQKNDFLLNGKTLKKKQESNAQLTS